MNDKNKDCGEWVKNLTPNDIHAHRDGLFALMQEHTGKHPILSTPESVFQCQTRFIKTFGEPE